MSSTQTVLLLLASDVRAVLIAVTFKASVWNYQFEEHGNFFSTINRIFHIIMFNIILTCSNIAATK